MKTKVESKTKMIYKKPMVKLEIIQMEYGIAAGSSPVVPGGPDGTNQPDVNDWTTDSKSNDLTF